MEKLQEYFDSIKDIEYGWHDKDGVLHDKIDPMLMLETYEMQPLENILKTKHAICWEMCELNRKFLTKNNYEFKTLFVFEKDNKAMPCHTTTVVYLNDKVYLLETSWINHKQLTMFNNIEEIFEYFKENFSDFSKNYNKDNLEFYDYNKPRENINCYDFYMNALNSIKLND